MATRDDATQLCQDDLFPRDLHVVDNVMLTKTLVAVALTASALSCARLYERRLATTSIPQGLKAGKKKKVEIDG